MAFPSEYTFPSETLFPSEEHSLLEWFKTGERYFETGLDRGVFYPKVGRAVPWNGLTSVDENGAESASEFLIDGRPFLYLPKTKEFSATITAYTYPDEFAEVMGVAEVINGMYIDSQQADSFGLSYRTLIGNDVDGIGAGYKIHLIYNATVAPQSSSYSSIGNTIAPTDFSWEIKAVPKAISGYRASAHVIIDTRKINVLALFELEKTLYGDINTLATLPDPQALIDILSFGNAVVINNNGDGTWTAEGSNDNVYLLDADTFQINNVYVTNNGDGTYEISSTI